MSQAVETKELKMHKNLLLDVIQRQAGTLGKAILEGVMNAVEADATRVDINFKEEDGKAFITIKDDGIGIKTLEEIENFWETFGTPHSSNEHVIWKRFRMGRGQVYSFGFNTWRTNQFKMEVDIKHKGLQYDLTQNLPIHNGCKISIELYENPVLGYPYYSEKGLKDAIKKQILFIDTPIYFNGEKININPKDAKWDFEDDNAYYSFGKGIDLGIYNLGAFVLKIPASNVGTCGIIVSKKVLKVNFARNDVQSDCEVYKEIQEVIKANRIKKSRKSYKHLNDDERRAILVDLRDGIQTYNEIKDLSLIPTAQGRKVSLSTISKSRQRWTFAPEGCRIADKVMESGAAFCVDDELLYQIDYSGPKQDFFTWLTDGHKAFLDFSDNYISYKTDTNRESLTKDFTNEHITLPYEKWNTVERRVVKILDSYNCWNGRKICIGVSDVSQAWTDGKSHITLERDFVKKVIRNMSYNGGVRLLVVMVHEMAHDEETNRTHYHSEAYDRNFRDLCESAHTILRYASRFANDLKKSRLEEKYQKIVDKQEKAKKAQKVKMGIGVEEEVLF